MVDLTKFCAAGQVGKYRLANPFSRGEYTWATDGKIIVRVPRMPDVPEVDGAPDTDRIWPDTASQFSAVKPATIPTSDMVWCDECNGRGHKHDCPECTCKCSECNGSGQVGKSAAVSIGPRAANAKYVRLLMALPELEIAPPPAEPEYRLQFRFSGGEGVLMMLRSHHELKIIASLETTP